MMNNEILLTLDIPVIQALVICYSRDLNWVQMYTTRPYISHVMIEFWYALPNGTIAFEAAAKCNLPHPVALSDPAFRFQIA